MEKYSQFRDRGSGIAPFFPVSSTPAGIYFPVYLFLFLFRLPFFITVATTYFLFLQWFPLGSLFKKAILWMMLGIPGIWWIDLQIDGVKKGSLAQKHQGRVPQPADIIASSFTSPIDSLYLAAIFDPIFTVSYPHTRQVQYISLFDAIFRALSPPQEHPPNGARMTDLKTLVAEHPKRVIVVFPECTTTNGKGILPFSPSLLLAPATTKIFPISLRYTTPDITTPIPRQYWAFIWNLLSQPTHCIRVRIAEVVYNTSKPTDQATEKKERYLTNFLDTLGEDSAMTSSTDTLHSLGDQAAEVNSDERKVIDKVGEALARLGRVKRVGLTLRDKVSFVDLWSK
ncbi:probable vacuolar protein sorting protein Vps66 [Rhynchosporium agropyri]|uniref:Probable vacuolar protein sorting protein Vps66 n=1 Tax=Rhynchosporium agropyri TaxID=914238 RepID=A0A1E1LF60_9HELO|nr:probable vacuolar protein sorting protein Vps66 [Rhynchosporium agropyri]